MIFRRIFYFLFFAVVCLIAGYFLQSKKTGEGSDVQTKYELVQDWPSLPAGFILGNPTGIGIDLDQNIFIFHRADRTWPLISAMPTTVIKSKTVLLFDNQSGKILDSW